jgi:phenylalanyl-tRNA synthetase beta chain
MARQFGGGQPELVLTNPMSPELEVMRPSLLPNLLESLIRSYDRGQENGALFEMGPFYGGITLEDQFYGVAGVRGGLATLSQWNEKERFVDIFDAKADLYAALADAGINTEGLQLKAQGPEWYHPGRSGTLYQGQKSVGRFGEPHPRLLAELGAKTPLVVFEVFLDNLPPFKPKKKKDPLVLSVFQPVERDFAFVLNKEVSAEAVIRAVSKVDKEQIRQIRVFDVFPLPEGAQISLGIRVRIEPQQKTLTEEDLTALSQKIIEEVHRTTGGVLRGV